MAKLSKILVIGSGGREHALAARLLACASVCEVVVSPGNAGTTHSALPGKVLRSVVGEPLNVAASERPDLVVIGPEVPLCEGLTDRLTDAGHVVFGPTRKAAQLEGSKSFMKRFAARHGIPSGRFHVVTSVEEAERAIHDFDQAPVVKADGLAAGKGVVVADTHAQALAAARGMLSGEAFGAAGRTVVIEERVPGAEASMHAICDGERFVLLPAAQDHKRIFDGDRGPNTGGMGTYAPAPLVTPALQERIRREIFERALRGMVADGQPFRGVLFAGLMISEQEEISLLEFNVRFGDPETQVLMAVLEGDLAEALTAAARGELRPELLEVSPRPRAVHRARRARLPGSATHGRCDHRAHGSGHSARRAGVSRRDDSAGWPSSHLWRTRVGRDRARFDAARSARARLPSRGFHRIRRPANAS
jgi:phosphoribosylamine--glycine ligase